MGLFSSLICYVEQMRVIVYMWLVCTMIGNLIKSAFQMKKVFKEYLQEYPVQGMTVKEFREFLIHQQHVS